MVNDSIRSFVDAEKVRFFFDLMNSSNIDYVLIKNIREELPNSLPDGKDIDILVKPESKILFEKVMKKYFFLKCHPWGS